MEKRLDTIAITRRNMRYAALYRSVKWVLETGVAAALVLLIAGPVLNVFPGGAVPGVAMNTGVLVLLATPALAVLISAGFFIILRDWWCMTAALVILVVLAVSFVLALQTG